MALFCTKCGTRIAEDSRFCTKCGMLVETETPQQYRPQYQAQYQPQYPRPPVRKKNSSAGLVVGIAAGVIMLAGIVLFLFWFLGNSSIPFLSRDPAADVAPTAPADDAVPGEDPEFAYLRGLDLSFDELADEGYFAGDRLDGAQLYTFNRFGDEAQFVMATEGLDGGSVPAALRTTLDKVFPDLAGLTAKEAEGKYSPYLEVIYSVGDRTQGIYETDHYLCTIYPDTSGKLRGDNIVEIRKKTAAPIGDNWPSGQDPMQVGSDYYILPQSSQRLLTYVDIENFTKQDMMLARNEIFARHGRMFNDAEVRSYFEAQSWYRGTIAPEDFSVAMLSDIEQKNVDFIKQYESGINGISQTVGDVGTVTTYNGYMIPQSSSRRLTYADIEGLSSWQLSIARNEIYARHGRMFDSAELRAYFEAQPWYIGYIAPSDFDASVLSATEQYNVSFIRSYE